MKRIGFAILALLAGLAPAGAGDVRQAGPYLPAGFCQLASVGSATQVSTCAGGIPQKTVIAQICVEAQAVRYRDDGVAPTASVGIPVAAGACFQYSGTLPTLQFIAQTTGAIVNLSFYK